ncbi:cellular retinoic acid-binding protein 2-like [Convolutriloba macropyga]|uniref:cellular retinoic acid-binding protein 2-like n=1 Tax=Convolutriloba macropyga TaxID=536237 RepID=UPI003F52243C
MESFCKTFEFSSFEGGKENLDNVYKAWGLNFLARKGIMAASKPLFRIKQSSSDSDSYYIISRSARSGLGSFRNVDGPMKLGSECDVQRRDKTHFNCKLVLDGGKLVQTMVAVKGDIPEMVITREIQEDGNLKLTETCEGNSATRIYAPADDVESKDDEAL